MKLLILHGPGQTEMTSKILSLKKSYDPLNIQEINSKALNWSKVRADILSESLFGVKRLVLLEEYYDLSLDELPFNDNLTIVLKYSKLHPKSPILKTAEEFKAEIINFSEEKEQSIFPFLDMLAEKNPKALKKFESIFDQYGSQYLLTMIFYLLRRNVTAGNSVSSFVQEKIQRQKKNFPWDILEERYLLCLETDFKIKSGKAEEKSSLFSLAQSFL